MLLQRPTLHTNLKVCINISTKQMNSTISDKVCNEWVDLVHNQIPSQFWQNLDCTECKLQEEARWRSVRDFADNCVKRRAFEDAFRKQYGVSGDVAIPEGGVPKNILTKLHLEKNDGQ